MEENQKNEQRSKDNNVYIIIPIVLSVVSIIFILFSIYIGLNSKEMFSGFAGLRIILIPYALGIIWGFYGFWEYLTEKLSKKYKYSSLISFIICVLIIFAIILGRIIFIKIFEYFNHLHLKNQPTPANIFVGDKY